jgi:hypothetical protein
MLLLAAAAALLAACGDENRSLLTSTPAANRISTSGNDTTHAPKPVVPGVEDTVHHPLPPPRAATALLAPLGASTLRGSARIATAGTGTAVSVSLAGGHALMTYAGAIRAGSCERAGVSVASLVPVTADSLGNGASASDVPLSVDSLLHHPFVVVFGPGGRPRACGAIRG